MGAEYFGHDSSVAPWSVATHKLSSQSEEMTKRAPPKAARKPLILALQPAGVSILEIEASDTPA
jgi:hypothetical protein